MLDQLLYDFPRGRSGYRLIRICAVTDKWAMDLRLESLQLFIQSVYVTKLWPSPLFVRNVLSLPAPALDAFMTTAPHVIKIVVHILDLALTYENRSGLPRYRLNSLYKPPHHPPCASSPRSRLRGPASASTSANHP
jgi:hypothetical protein